MDRKNIIKSINENLEQLPHKTYIWNRGFPRVKTLDEITKKEIFIEIHALRYPITQTKGVLFTVLFAFTPHIIERGCNKISAETLNKILSQVQKNE
jgi:hypothetical protein